MYKHVSKCENNKIKKRKKKNFHQSITETPCPETER
jgi:hypothetical protein